MQAGMKGMDIEVVEGFAGKVRNQIGAVDGIKTIIDEGQALPWQGEDYTAFLNNDLAEVTKMVTALRTAMEAMTQNVTNQVTAQREASAV